MAWYFFHFCVLFKLQLLKANDLSPRSSISADDITSDIGDPLHDESILQELFYKEVRGQVIYIIMVFVYRSRLFVVHACSYGKFVFVPKTE